METVNSLTILIYRPSVLQVVGFVVRCIGLMRCFLIREFLTDLGFGREVSTLPLDSRLDLDQMDPPQSAFLVEAPQWVKGRAV